MQLSNKVPGSGGQRLILATPKPNPSRVPIGWMGSNNESRYGSQKDPGFENEILEKSPPGRVSREST
jgi:hypothetical protein